MKFCSHQISQRRLGASSTRFSVAICSAALLLSGQAQSQTIYRTVDANGRITFSDQTPAASNNATALSAGGRPIATADAALPFELRQVAAKFPVTLYSAVNCAPCGSGRALLLGRGVPFTEKSITTSQDNEALQRISGANSLPFLTIGVQQIKGFSDSEWSQFLDAAGYPKSSVLPPGYRAPAATPLVAVQQAVPTAAPDESQIQPVRQEPRQAPADSAANPAGIKF